MLTKIDILMLSLLAILTLTSTWMNADMTQGHGSLVQIEQTATSNASDNAIMGADRTIPDFSAMTDVRSKKKAFFSFMLPLIEAQNESLLTLRGKIQRLKSQTILTSKDKEWLSTLAKRYKIAASDKFDALFFTRLLDGVDVIPASLALAQSANESAWGASRFAQQGNNLFGQWCFSKGCGLIPRGRPPGAKYEVQKFASAADSVRAYMHNLNTHYQYETLRAIRATQRSKGEPVTGPALAAGLHAYSIRGVDYVDELIGMMASNSLVDYDVGDVTPEA